MSKYNDPDIIEIFLKGKMDASNQKDFEKAMSQDITLQQEVALMKDLLLGIQVAGDQYLAQSIELAEIELEEKGYFKDYEDDLDQDVLNGIQLFGAQRTDTKNMEPETKSAEQELRRDSSSKPEKAKIRQLPIKRILAMAASFLLLITMSIYFLNSNNNNETLFANNFQPPVKVLDQQIINFSELGIATKYKTKKIKLKEMLVAVKKCDNPTCKTTAINNFNNIFPNDLTATFFLATTYMEQENYDLAAQNFEALAKKSDFALQEDARWYQALCYLKMDGKQEEAVNIFQEIVKGENAEYGSKAKMILEEIVL